MIVSAKYYTSGTECRAAALALHAKFYPPARRARSVVEPPLPAHATQTKVIRPRSPKPEWQRRNVHFDAHVLASRSILELIRTGQVEFAKAGRVTIAHVVDEVLDQFPGVTVRCLKSGRRGRAVTTPRSIAMYEAKMRTGKSYPEIGRWFGGRDHTTAIHSVKKIEGLIVDGYVEIHGFRYRVKGAE